MFQDLLELVEEIESWGWGGDWGGHKGGGAGQEGALYVVPVPVEDGTQIVQKAQCVGVGGWREEARRYRR